MNKKFIIIAVLALVVLGGGTYALTGTSNDEKPAVNSQVPNEDEAMAMKKEAEAMEKEKMAKEAGGDAMQKDGAAMAMSKGTYVNYDAAKLADAEKGNVVLFFHAPWCPTCKEANKNFEATSAPDGLTLLKVDYDSSNDLKKKYGVTYQHTFVQVDKDGNLLKKWNASNNYDDIKKQEI